MRPFLWGWSWRECARQLAPHLLMPDIIVPYQPLGQEDNAPCETVQIDFWDSEAFAPAFLAARGAGKTLSGAGKTVKNVLLYRSDALVVGPRYESQVRAVLVPKYLEIIPKQLIYCPGGAHPYHETHKKIILKDLDALNAGRDEPGCTIWFRSGDEPDTVEGFTVGTVHIDEAGRMVEQVFGLALGCLRDPKGPGQIIVTCTPPASRKHWVNRKWGNGRWEQVPDRKGRRIINADANYPAWNMIWTDNYKLSEEWRRNFAAGLDLSTPFGRQQALGEVVEFAGLVFDMFSEKHIQTMPEDFQRVAGGVDRAALGGTTAVKVVGLQPSDRLYSCFEWGKKHADLDDLGYVLADVQHRYPGIIFHMDPHSQGEEEIVKLRTHGIHICRARKKDMVDFGVRLMWRYMRPQADGLLGYHISPECPMTIEQYGSWEYVEGKGGGEIGYEDVQTRGKDFIDAERYAIVGLIGAEGQTPVPIDWQNKGRSIYPRRELAGVR